MVESTNITARPPTPFSVYVWKRLVTKCSSKLVPKEGISIKNRDQTCCYPMQHSGLSCLWLCSAECLIFCKPAESSFSSLFSGLLWWFPGWAGLYKALNSASTAIPAIETVESSTSRRKEKPLSTSSETAASRMPSIMWLSSIFYFFILLFCF